MPQNPPGQGQSKSAKRRRARRQNKNKNQQPPQQKQQRGQPRSFARQRLPRRPLSLAASSYLRSLVRPNWYKSRVPDESGFATSNFTLTNEGVIGVSPNGFLGMYSRPWIQASFYVSNTGGIAGTAAQATESGVAFTAVGLPSAAAAQALYKAVRLVSACIEVKPTSGTMNDFGGLTVYSFDRFATPATSHNQALAFPHNRYYSVKEVNSGDGVCVFWRPMDNLEWEYKSSTANNLELSGIGFIMSGVVANSSCYLKITANFEGIPSSDTFEIVDAGPSPTDTPGMSSVLNALSDVTPSYAMKEAAAVLGSIAATAAIRNAQQGGLNVANNQIEHA